MFIIHLFFLRVKRHITSSPDIKSLNIQEREIYSRNLFKLWLVAIEKLEKCYCLQSNTAIRIIFINCKDQPVFYDLWRDRLGESCHILDKSNCVEQCS